MSESFYFQHDYSARNDDKILMLRAKYGNEGYAIFFYCLETMAERGDGYIMPPLIGGLSLGYGVAIEWLHQFLEFCASIDLLCKDDKGFYSPRMVNHIKLRNLYKTSGKIGAEKRWKNSPPNAPPIAPLMQRKGKERKGNTTLSEGRSAPFSPPTLKEINQFVMEEGYSVDPEQFWNFYESKGWVVGKSKMKNWKAAVRTWESKNKPKEPPEIVFLQLVTAKAEKIMHEDLPNWLKGAYLGEYPLRQIRDEIGANMAMGFPLSEITQKAMKDKKLRKLL